MQGRDATYAAPLKVKVRLYNKETDEISRHEIFMGDLPLMTETGTFVINGAEASYCQSVGFVLLVFITELLCDKLGKTLYSCTVPNRGAWLGMRQTLTTFLCQVDRTRKEYLSQYFYVHLE